MSNNRTSPEQGRNSDRSLLCGLDTMKTRSVYAPAKGYQKMARTSIDVEEELDQHTIVSVCEAVVHVTEREVNWLYDTRISSLIKEICC
jgi:hypothetical protein